MRFNFLCLRQIQSSAQRAIARLRSSERFAATASGVRPSARKGDASKDRALPLASVKIVFVIGLAVLLLVEVEVEASPSPESCWTARRSAVR